MGLFDIKPWLVKKKDGTKKQVMPQTTIKGVIGLEKELAYIEAVTESLTGKKFNKNYSIVQKGPAGPQGPKGPKGDMDLSQIEIGGRNLLLDTGKSITAIGDNSVNGNFDAQSHGRYFLAGGKKLSDLYNKYGSSGYLTLSFDWFVSGDNISGQFNPQWDNTPWTGLSDAGVIKPSAQNNSGHYKSTVQLNHNGYSTSIATGIMFRQDNLQGNITISNVKLEAGNVATDWSPAPEEETIDDSQLVHKTNNETIAGDKTFTGYTTFSGNGVNLVDASYVTLVDGSYGHPTVKVSPFEINLTTGDSGLKVSPFGVKRTADGGKTWSDDRTIMSGSYGLKVSPIGFKKTTDGGKTWVDAKI